MSIFESGEIMYNIMVNYKILSIFKSNLIPCLLGVLLSIRPILAQTSKGERPIIEGKMVYHSYSDYEARDSKIYLVDFETKEKICINDYISGAYHTMNASFNREGTAIVFMGIVNKSYGEEWDIFLYRLDTKELIDLTKNNNFRNEDPKFSPDGTKVVYKQGYWNSVLDKMVYDIWEMDLQTGESYPVTQDMEEESMPYYSTKGDAIYCMQGSGEGARICKIEKIEEETVITPIYAETGVQAYYPVTYKDKLYFSKWYSAQNKSDVIVIMEEGKRGIVSQFGSSDYNSSDPCPISDRLMIISSTMPDSKGGYDLYIVDIVSGENWSLDEYGISINDELQQLGASCYIRNVQYGV